MTPTQRSYVISTVIGAVSFGLLAALDVVAKGGSPLTWQTLAAAFVGGMALWARDYAKNQMGARLEKPDAQAGIRPG